MPIELTPQKIDASDKVHLPPSMESSATGGSPRDLTQRISDEALNLFARKSKIIPTLSISAIYSSFWLTSLLLSYLNHWGALLMGAIFVGALQHHLAILMHEAAHFLLFPKKYWNDRIGHALCSSPLFIHLNYYRYFHLQHHSHTGDPTRDPEVQFYNEVQYGYGGQLKDSVWGEITGRVSWRSLRFFYNFLRINHSNGALERSKLEHHLWSLLGWIFLFLPTYILGSFSSALALWFIALIFVTPQLLRLHGISEHTGKNEVHEQDKTLSHDLKWYQNFFLYPLNSDLHLEHHLFPQVPWHHLRQLRKHLLKDPYYRDEVHGLTVDGIFWGRRTVRDILFGRH